MNINLRPKNCSGQNLYGRYYSRCLTGDDTWRDEWISVLIQELNTRQELQKVRVEDMQYVGDTQSISSKDVRGLRWCRTRWTYTKQSGWKLLPWEINQARGIWFLDMLLGEACGDWELGPKARTVLSAVTIGAGLENNVIKIFTCISKPCLQELKWQ